jgi:hypothetical protein
MNGTALAACWRFECGVAEGCDEDQLLRSPGYGIPGPERVEQRSRASRTAVTRHPSRLPLQAAGIERNPAAAGDAGLGHGSRRDVAMLMIEALRSFGFATRFASGHLAVPQDSVYSDRKIFVRELVLKPSRPGWLRPPSHPTRCLCPAPLGCEPARRGFRSAAAKPGSSNPAIPGSARSPPRA